MRLGCSHCPRGPITGVFSPEDRQGVGTATMVTGAQLPGGIETSIHTQRLRAEGTDLLHGCLCGPVPLRRMSKEWSSRAQQGQCRCSVQQTSYGVGDSSDPMVHPSSSV